MRLSSHQVGLLLSTVWVQATSPENSPANYEALAHTYTVRPRTARYIAVRQLTSTQTTRYRVREKSKGEIDHRRPIEGEKGKKKMKMRRRKKKKRRRRGYIPPFPVPTPPTRRPRPRVARTLSSPTGDSSPVRGDGTSHLLCFCQNSSHVVLVRCFQLAFSLRSIALKHESEFLDYSITSMEFLEKVERDDKQLKESVISHLMKKYEKLPEVTETARQVSSLPTSTIPVPYDQMKSQCEALVIGKQQKMSVLQGLKHQQEDWRVMPEGNIVDLVDMQKARLPNYAFISVCSFFWDYLTVIIVCIPCGLVAETTLSGRRVRIS
ncbi:hypothetical protein BHM03_00047926 [Ensete ventricosum]|nr:hypothetical protein BHM03_00047926 [Ensete ventricosum]